MLIIPGPLALYNCIIRNLQRCLALAQRKQKRNFQLVIAFFAKLILKGLFIAISRIHKRLLNN